MTTVALPALAIDTASPLASVAVGTEGKKTAVRSVPQRQSSPVLLGLMAECLEESDVAPRDLEAILVLRGPGSFTGLRVGLATVLGLTAAWDVRTATLGTLPALALLAEAPRVAAVPARRGEWIVESFAAGPSPRAEGEPRVLLDAELSDAWPDRPWIGFGLRRVLGERALEPPPLASVMIERRELASWDDDPAGLTRPLYVQGPPVHRPAPGPQAGGA